MRSPIVNHREVAEFAFKSHKDDGHVVTPFEFGDTCPLLQVAKKHGVEEHYDAILMSAHYRSFGGEGLQDSLASWFRLLANKNTEFSIEELNRDIDKCVLRMHRLYTREEFAL